MTITITVTIIFVIVTLNPKPIFVTILTAAMPQILAAFQALDEENQAAASFTIRTSIISKGMILHSLGFRVQGVLRTQNPKL